MRRLALPALGALAAALIAGPARADSRHYITGVVTNGAGQPVARAIVSLSPGNVELVTDAEGRFTIDYLRDDTGERTKLAKRTDYELEVYKPGFHPESRAFYYKKGAIQVDGIVVTQDAIAVDDDGQNIDPSLYSDGTQTDGATYEGQ